MIDHRRDAEDAEGEDCHWMGGGAHCSTQREEAGTREGARPIADGPSHATMRLLSIPMIQGGSLSGLAWICVYDRGTN